MKRNLSEKKVNEVEGESITDFLPKPIVNKHIAMRLSDYDKNIKFNRQNQLDSYSSFSSFNSFSSWSRSGFFPVEPVEKDK